ncbi:hypothetical protein QX201_004365 [Fusarium graminearum]
MICAECTIFKDSFESLNENSPKGIYRTPFQNFTALERSAFLGCKLCQIIYQTWHHERYSEKYKKDSPIDVEGYVRNLESRSQGIFTSYQDSTIGGFTLADFTHNKVSEEQFGQYKTACRQIIDPHTPEAIVQIASLASTWIRTCRETHQHCQSYYEKGEPRVLPTRLVDVGTDFNPPRLFVPQRHLGSFEYIALSYAWGSKSFIKTTYSNLEAMTQHLPWAQLPKTIQDAILVTRSLGVRYLWVDALCILQSEGPEDAKHKEDWSYEAARFGKYYENALMTIAATGASSSDQGLFVPRSPLRLEPKSVTFRPGTTLSYTVRSMIPSWLSETLSGPLSKRGWALQERLLSRRVLHFSENMILWECHDCRATELDPQGLYPRGLDASSQLFLEFMTKCRDLYAKGLVPDDFLDEWYRFINTYTKSDFTFVSDRLPALSGIAALIQQCTQQKYVAGLWESDIARGLAWQSYGDFRFDTAHLIDPQIMSSPTKGDSQLILPSWSWATSRGCVFHFDYETWTPLVEVEAWQVNSQGTSTSGQLRVARLTLRGVLAMLNLTELGFLPYTTTQTADNALRRDPEEVFISIESVYLDAKMDFETRQMTHPCLLVGSTRLSGEDAGGALILKTTGNCMGGIDEYMRIGFISLPMEECLSIFTDEKTTISLV